MNSASVSIFLNSGSFDAAKVALFLLLYSEVDLSSMASSTLPFLDKNTFEPTPMASKARAKLT